LTPITTVYPPEELKVKLSEEQHFLKRVLGSEKVFIIGSENELEELAG